MQRLFELGIHLFRYLLHKNLYSYYFFGDKVAVDKNVKIRGCQFISIGNSVHLQDNVWLNIVGSDKSRKLVIGDHCDIGRNTFISVAHEVVIESSVLIAPNVFISDHSHKYTDKNKSILAQGITEPKTVTIKSNSWIGANVVILPGTTIGKHCVIGANSVVKGNFNDYSIIAGNPARAIKRIE